MALIATSCHFPPLFVTAFANDYYFLPFRFIVFTSCIYQTEPPDSAMEVTNVILKMSKEKYLNDSENWCVGKEKDVFT